MTTTEIIRNLNSVRLSVLAHPDCVEHSEFADQVSTLSALISEMQNRLQEEQQFPLAPAGMQIGVSTVRALGREWRFCGGSMDDSTIILEAME